MADLLPKRVRLHVDDAKEPAAVIGANLEVIYSNSVWPSHWARLKDPVMPCADIVDSYECATLRQAIVEIIEGKLKLFTRRCTLRPPSGIDYIVQVTVTVIHLTSGELCAGLWFEKAQTKPPSVTSSIEGR